MSFDINCLPPNPRILLVRLRSIGDVTLSTAVFPSIKENFPDCKLDFLVMPPNDELVRSNPYLDEIVLLDGQKGWLAFIGLLRRLRKTSYDMVIDLHGGPRSALVTALSKAKYKVGLARSRRARFYNVTVDPVFDGSVLAVQFQTRILELLGFKVRQEAPKIYVAEEELASVVEILNKIGVNANETFAVIHPAVNHKHDEWQPEKFARIADHFQSRHKIQMVFASGPNQQDQLERILSRMQTPVFSLGNQIDLRQFAALCQRAFFLLCHNSGPMHISAAVGTPVFALFGATSPGRWVPQVDVHHVFYKNIECSPCSPKPLYDECYKGNAACKREIAAEEVIQAIEEKLNIPVSQGQK